VSKGSDYWNPKGEPKTADDGGRKKVKRVRKVTTVPSRDHQEGPRTSRGSGDGEREWEDDEDYLRFISVPPMGEESPVTTTGDPIHQQTLELFTDFQMNVAINEDTFRQFIYWADETDGVVLEDLLVATKAVYDRMDASLPCSKGTWDEFVEMADLVEVTNVSDSEVEYALEIFSKTYDQYMAELVRLDEERSKAERMSSQRISDEILAEDDGLLAAAEEEEVDAPEDEASLADLERWDKVVDDVRSKINSTKAEFDEVMEELSPYKQEREMAISRLQIMEKDVNRKKGRLDRYQSGRISDAKSVEIQNLEREVIRIEDEQADWSSRLSIAQERIDQRIGICAEKRSEFLHIQQEVGSLLDSLSAQDRVAVSDALSGELADLDEIMEDVDTWLGELTAGATVGGGDSAAIIDTVQPSLEGRTAKAQTIADEVIHRYVKDTEISPDDPPVVFMDSEVRRMLAELPIERPPEEELLLRIDSLHQELINRENTIQELEHSIELLMEDKEGSTTAVELERNKVRMELVKTQDELTEKQGLLEQYLDVIRNLESQMELKDRELRGTLALNKRKTDELRQKEFALENLEKELIEKQEEFRQERQELQDRESRLNSQVSEREGLEREMAKKDLTLELRNEQIRKKMDRLTGRELELQRINSQQKEMEEMLTLKERELQNLKTEVDVREDELRRKETAIEERNTEVTKLQSEVSKLEHRVRSRDETLRRREAHNEEEEERARHLEASIAEREVQIHDREREVALREAKVEGAQISLDAQREQIDSGRRDTTRERQETERLRIAQEHRHEDLIRREDQLSVREDTMRERERALQIREERLELERADQNKVREDQESIELKWSAKEKNLIEQLETFNNEKEDLMEDWKAAKSRTRELEREKAEMTARLIAAESSLMAKDGEILSLAKEMEQKQGRGGDQMVELEAGVKTSMSRIMEDVKRQRDELKALDTRSSKVEARERELIEMEEILNNERERVRKLLSEQEKGRTDMQEALEQIASRSTQLEEMEVSVRDRGSTIVAREEDLASREDAVRQREREMERLTTAEDAEARAEDREEELMDLQKGLEDRTTSLEQREEELEKGWASIRGQETEFERQKGELMLARENLLKAGNELEEIRSPAQSPIKVQEAKGVHRAPSGLAMRAAEFAALSKEEEAEEVKKAAASGETEPDGQKPLARLRCKICSTVIPIFTNDRPLDIECPRCGKGGILK
jgi:chromosome segregation ATPase